jgi:hypothetical protein
LPFSEKADQVVTIDPYLSHGCDEIGLSFGASGQRGAARARHLALPGVPALIFIKDLRY